jgi:hypothetical protein
MNPEQIQCLIEEGKIWEVAMRDTKIDAKQIEQNKIQLTFTYPDWFRHLDDNTVEHISHIIEQNAQEAYRRTKE